jgi:WD40 repeat protein
VFQDGHAEIHSLISNLPPLSWPGQITARSFVEFSPDSHSALVSIVGRGAVRVDLASRREELVANAGRRPQAVQFDPTSRLLAMAIGQSCSVWSMTDQTQLWERTYPHRVNRLAWSPDGTRLAAVYDSWPEAPAPNQPRFGLWLLDPASGLIQSESAPHELAIERIGFDASSRFLVSVGWDGRVVWHNVQTGDAPLIAEGATLALRFAPDGTRIGFSPSREELAIAEIAPTDVFHEWRKTTPPDEEVYAAALSPAGEWFASATGSGIHLWDTTSGTEQTVQPLPAKHFWTTVAFHPNGQSILYSAANFGVMQAAILKTNGPDGQAQVQLAPARCISPGPAFVLQEFAPDGRSLVVGEIKQQTRNDRVWPTFWLWEDCDPRRAHKLAENFAMSGYRLVADGRWGISTENLSPDLWLWDPARGERVRSLGIPLSAMGQVSSDGRCLITSTRQEFVLWDTSSWIPKARWPARPNQRTGAEGVFSHDGHTFATVDASGRIDLFALPAGRLLLELPPPQPMRFQAIKFSQHDDRLFALRGNGRVYEWHLGQLHQHLAALRLDW